MKAKTTWLIVLGDFGRSPRMQYHAGSLSKQAGNYVCVLAQHHSTPLKDLATDPCISLCNLPKTPAWLGKLPSQTCRLLIKTSFQVLLLLHCLMFKLPKPDTVLVQSPPAIPTLMICVMACWWHNAKLVIDWHNFGYTIMAMTMGQRHPLVCVARWYERFFGRLADGHLCVSTAMQQFLSAEWGVVATVFRDTPPHWFHRTSMQERHELFTRVAAHLSGPDSLGHSLDQPHSQHHVDRQQDKDQQKQDPGVSDPGQNVFTHLVGQQPQLKADRPALVVSSTSWTVDEDFQIMLDAAVQYEEAALNSTELPDLVIAVTGKGPQKVFYEERMQQLGLQHVAFNTLWLEAADYPLLLGSADLGVCLHTSSSGLDLPMKSSRRLLSPHLLTMSPACNRLAVVEVVDMFGCGLPVCAAAYSCIGELVKDGQTGLLFSSSRELAQQWVEVLHGFPNQPSRQLLHMQNQVQHSTENWSTTWENIKPMFV